MDKYRNKYRIQSHRKPNWDYSADGFYFLTIVTQNRECNLGIIENNEMILSDFGKIVEQEWFKSFEIRNELILHQFILMPNHLHAIIEIRNENRDGLAGDDVDTHETVNELVIETGNELTHVETHGRVSLPIEPPDLSSIKRNPPVRLPKSISSFIAGFKSAVNTKIDDNIDERQLKIPKYNRHNHFFQPNYHDHIIRNELEYHTISYYIETNPLNWNKDKMNG